MPGAFFDAFAMRDQLVRAEVGSASSQGMGRAPDGIPVPASAALPHQLHKLASRLDEVPSQARKKRIALSASEFPELLQGYTVQNRRIAHFARSLG